MCAIRTPGRRVNRQGRRFPSGRPKGACLAPARRGRLETTPFRPFQAATRGRRALLLRPDCYQRSCKHLGRHMRPFRAEQDARGRRQDARPSTKAGLGLVVKMAGRAWLLYGSSGSPGVDSIVTGQIRLRCGAYALVAEGPEFVRQMLRIRSIREASANSTTASVASASVRTVSLVGDTVTSSSTNGPTAARAARGPSPA